MDSGYFTQAQMKMLKLAIATLESLEYPTKKQQVDPQHFKKMKENVKKIEKCISAMNIIPKSVVWHYNSSKTDYSIFERVYFRVKRSKTSPSDHKKVTRDRLAAGTYIATCQFNYYKKGRLEGEPNYKEGFAQNGLQISRLPPSKTKGQTPSQYLDIVRQCIELDFDPAFLSNYVLFVYIYGHLLYSLKSFGNI